jgi:hypothetical protein
MKKTSIPPQLWNQLAHHQVDAEVGSMQCILPLISSSYKHAGKRHVKPITKQMLGWDMSNILILSWLLLLFTTVSRLNSNARVHVMSRWYAK